MQKFFAIILTALALTGCVSNERFYQPASYQQSGVVNQKPFNQVAAECKMQTTTHNALWDTYELEIPRYKACMEMNGYVYNQPPR